MEEIAVSKFKATCLAVLQRVSRTGQPVLVTRFGKPIAEVVPPGRQAAGSSWLGGMRGRAEIRGDVVGPVLEAEAWQAARD
jgi:prevent-host-death family protein